MTRASQIGRKGNTKGFTLVELIIVIFIICVLAAVALPLLMAYQVHSSNSSALSATKNAYIAAQVYFNDVPNGSISSVETLIDCGFRKTSSVSVTVSGHQSDLVITAYHSEGDKTYTVNHEGTIQW